MKQNLKNNTQMITGLVVVAVVVVIVLVGIVYFFKKSKSWAIVAEKSE